ncbi:MAG TPA: hypothetical protein VIY48_05205 [Candidatus Paceibacterota bacterium]
MAKLTAAERDALPSSQFIFPDTRKYPIPDQEHAYAAIKDSAGRPEEATVRAAVCKKFSIGCNLGKSSPVDAEDRRDHGVDEARENG